MSYKQDLAQFAVLNKIVEDYHKMLMKKYKDSHFIVHNSKHTYFEMGEKYKITSFGYTGNKIYIRHLPSGENYAYTICIDNVEIVP